MRQILSLLLVLIVGFAAIFGLSKKLEDIKPKPDETRADDDLYFSADELSAAGHDFRGLIADWYWVNSLQYLGGKMLANAETADINNLKALNPRLLYPMLDTATTLDPRFITAYTYGATVLPAIDNALAIKLIEKGIAANPDEWKLYNNLGYIHWQMKNYPKAAEVYSEGAKKHDAPAWMKQMSAKMLADGGSRSFALDVYRQMFETAEDEQTKKFAELRYMQVESFDELETINAVLNNQKTQINRCPNALAEIIPSLQTKKLPNGKTLKIDKSGNILDPSGVPYILESSKCAVQIDKDKSKIPAN